MYSPISVRRNPKIEAKFKLIKFYEIIFYILFGVGVFRQPGHYAIYGIDTDSRCCYAVMSLCTREKKSQRRCVFVAA